MSKRARPIVVVEEEIKESFPQEIWFLICEFLKWYDVETLSNFICVSRSALRFVQPLIRTLMGNMLQLDDKKNSTLRNNKLITSVRRHFAKEDKVVKHLIKCCRRFYSVEVATLGQWREWTSIILSMFRLCQLHRKYTKRKTMAGNRAFWHDRVVRTSSVATPSETCLSHIFYCKKWMDYKPVSTARLDRLTIVHVVEGLEADNTRLLAKAAADVKQNRSQGEQEIYLPALYGSVGDNRRAVCYYALAKKLTVRAAKPTDSLRDVVLADPLRKGEFLHIYSKTSAVVEKFLSSCYTYKGNTKDALFAIHIYTHKEVHNMKCVRLCRDVSRNIKETNQK